MADLVCHYTGAGRTLTQENMRYIIVKDYNDHLKSVKAMKKNQDIKLIKFHKETVALCWFEAAMTFMNVYIGTWNGYLA